ncbi:MAG: LamG-like jellyroll fold domain-containing protein [Opitutaceae bacterium]|nr:LamG-like jellyroll fold domain-containing protein [Opitutaceae bacterium]
MKRQTVRTLSYSSSSAAVLLVLAAFFVACHASTLRAQTVIYTADFEVSEGYSVGDLNSQSNWLVDQGAANVATGSAFSGTQSVLLAANSPSSKIQRVFSQFAGQAVVFVDFYSRPSATADVSQSTNFDTGPTRLGFVSAGTNGEIYAYDGNGIGGGSWIATGRLIPIDANAQAQDWARYTLRHDFTAKRSDLYVNGTMVKSGLRFIDDSTVAFSLFSAQAPANALATLDYFYVASINPLFVDADNDGIEDAWENRYLGTTAHGAYDDPGSVGRTLAESYRQGLNPWPAATLNGGLQLWYRADRGVTKDAGNKVSRWVDLSGNGVHGMQSTASAQPLQTTLPVAGRAGLRFDGSATTLRSAAADLIKGSNDVTVVVVAKPGASQPTYADILDYDHTTAPYGGFVLQQNGDAQNQYGLGWWYNGGWQGLTPTMPVAAGSIQIMTIVKSGTAQDGYVNGEQKFGASVPAEMHANPPRIFAVGASSIGRYFNGDVAEVLVYNRALSATERQQLEAALTARYFDDEDSLPGAWELKYLGTLDYGAGDDPGGVGRTLLQSYQQSLNPWPGATVASGLQLWYRADLGVTKDVSSNVSRWVDLSGNGAHVEQSTGSAQPLAVAAGLGNKPAVRFDGTRRLRSSASADLVKGSNDISVIAVIKPSTSQATYADILDYDHTTSPSGGFVLQQNGDALNQFGLGWWYNGGWQGLASTAALSSGVGQLLAIVKSSTVQTGYVNAEQKFSASVPDTMHANVPRFVGVGAVGASSASRYFNGDVAEMLVYNRALTTTERQQIEASLIEKYSLLGPPDFTASAISTSQVSLTWGAASGSVLGYIVERQLAGGSFVTVGESTGRLAFLDGGLSAGTQYTYRVRARYESGYSNYGSLAFITLPAIGAGSELPMDGMRLWLRADAGITSSGGLVATWRDQSGLGHHATQTNSSYQPALVANAVSGLPIVRFDGSNDFMQWPAALTSGLAQADAFVVVRSAVATHSSSHGLWRLGGYTDGSGAGSSRYPTGGGEIVDDFGSVTASNMGMPPASITSYHLYEVSSRVGERAGRFNGALLSTSANATVVFPNNAQLGTGYLSNNTAYYNLNGDISEIIIFDRVLTTLEHQKVGEYLTRRYALAGIPVPVTPTNLAATIVSPTRADLSWTAALPATGVIFTIERKTGAGAFASIAEVANALVFSDTTVTEGQQYTYRVNARSYAGSSSYSGTFAYPPPIDSDGDGVSDPDEVAAQTNPVDYFNGRAFSSTTPGNGSLYYAYDASGRIVTAAYGSGSTAAFTLDAASNLTNATTGASGAQPIAAWRQANSLPADGSGNGADSVVLAADGLPNLAKYAFGLVPQTTTTTDQPVITLTEIGTSRFLTLRYRRPHPAPVDLVYTVQVSSDGLTWTAGSGATIDVSTTVNGSIADVTVRDATGVGWPAFGRRIRVLIERRLQP